MIAVRKILGNSESLKMTILLYGRHSRIAGVVLSIFKRGMTVFAKAPDVPLNTGLSGQQENQQTDKYH